METTSQEHFHSFTMIHNLLTEKQKGITVKKRIHTLLRFPNGVRTNYSIDDKYSSIFRFYFFPDRK